MWRSGWAACTRPTAAWSSGVQKRWECFGRSERHWRFWAWNARLHQRGIRRTRSASRPVRNKGDSRAIVASVLSVTRFWREGMIRGVHTMFYSSEPEALRAFFREKLGLPAVDVGEGWLIFDLPEADMGCHPADPTNGAPSGTHDISFYCDDIERTVAELTGRGVEFT